MQRLAVKEKFGYGLGDTARNIVFQVVINFMLYFYTCVFGITAAAAGTLMLAVRLFDAVTDPSWVVWLTIHAPVGVVT